MTRVVVSSWSPRAYPSADLPLDHCGGPSDIGEPCTRPVVALFVAHGTDGPERLYLSPRCGIHADQSRANYGTHPYVLLYYPMDPTP